MLPGARWRYSVQPFVIRHRTSSPVAVPLRSAAFVAMTRGSIFKVLVVISAIGCAAQNRASPTREAAYGPGSELEQAAASEAARNDLSLAFDAKADLGSAGTGGGSPAARIPPPATAEDPTAEQKARFAERAAEAKRSLARGSLADAQAALGELARMAEALGPAHQQQVFELRYQIGAVQKDAMVAQQAAEQWLLSCGPQAIDSCRRRALIALEQAGRLSPNGKRLLERTGRIRQADACLARAEASAKAGTAIPDCVDGGLATYRQTGDQLMVARAILARAISLEVDSHRWPQAVQMLAQAEKTCSEKRCLEVRRRALRRLTSVQMKLGNLDGAARAALTDMGLALDDMPSPDRFYLRTKEVDRLCELLDQREGPGSCRRLEKSLLGTYTFRDYSQQTATRQGLTVEDVRPVNQHFQVLIRDCLTAEGERMEPWTSLSFRLRWLVLNDGRVDQVHLDPNHLESGALADCLRKQFAVWRYPRYRGEWQHVEQSFTVTARERNVAVRSALTR